MLTGGFFSGPLAYLPSKSDAYTQLASLIPKIDSGEPAQTRKRPHTGQSPHPRNLCNLLISAK